MRHTTWSVRPGPFKDNSRPSSAHGCLHHSRTRPMSSEQCSRQLPQSRSTSLRFSFHALLCNSAWSLGPGLFWDHLRTITDENTQSVASQQPSCTLADEGCTQTTCPQWLLVLQTPHAHAMCLGPSKRTKKDAFKGPFKGTVLFRAFRQ